MKDHKGIQALLQLPEPKPIVKRYIPNVDVTHKRAKDVAGPLIKAGMIRIAHSSRPNYATGLHTPPYHRIGIVIQGKIKFRCGTETKIAERGDLVLTPAGAKLKRTGLGPISWIYLDLEDTPMWSPLKSAGFYVRKYESADMMYILCTRIISALRSQDVYSIQLARESASMMLVLLQREFDQADNPWHSKRINSYLEIISLIRERPDQQWDRETIAKHLNISTRLMTKEFRRNFNMAPAQMVKNIRMEYAAQQLINTERKLYGIATSVGYESPFSFSRIFKKHFGVSPNQYRNMSFAERQKLTLGM